MVAWFFLVLKNRWQIFFSVSEKNCVSTFDGWGIMKKRTYGGGAGGGRKPNNIFLYSMCGYKNSRFCKVALMEIAVFKNIFNEQES